MNEMKKPTQADVEQSIKTLIEWAGDSPLREGLKDTPSRVAKAFKEYFKGYQEDPIEVLKKTFEQVSGYQELILLKDIPFYSHCEHHLAPIVGCAHIAYLPNNRVVGISKLARVVDLYAKRLQLQERMTAEIGDAIYHVLKPHGVAVMVKAQHHCMMGRGVHKNGSKLVSMHFNGDLKTNLSLRAEVLTLFNSN